MTVLAKDHRPWHGLVVHQPQAGYRFSQDALLLAAHADPKPGERVLELGAGCGIVSLILALRHPGIEIVGVEVQPALARLAEKNSAENGFTRRISMLCQDMKTLRPEMCGGPFDMVVSNPPYRPTSAGRINLHSQRAVARHEISITLPELVSTAKTMLRPGGRLMLIYPNERLGELFAQLTKAKIGLQWLRFIHSRTDREARLAISAAKNGGPSKLRVRPPLILYSEPGVYTPEAASILKNHALRTE
ncbi:MAG: methyltransferase [Desulfobacterales bacterium]